MYLYHIIYSDYFGRCKNHYWLLIHYYFHIVYMLKTILIILLFLLLCLLLVKSRPYVREGFADSDDKFVYKNNPKQTVKKYVFQEANISENDSRITKLIKNLESNGIAVSRISKAQSFLFFS